MISIEKNSWERMGRNSQVFGFLILLKLTITNQYPQSSQGLNHQPKSTYSGTHGFSRICSRGWPSQTSTGVGWGGVGWVEALYPMKALVGGLVSKVRREGMGEGCFSEGNQERG
jgi:hypothetical protein